MTSLEHPLYYNVERKFYRINVLQMDESPFYRIDTLVCLIHTRMKGVPAMETTYYTLCATEAAAGGVAQASGDDGRQITFVRQPAPKKAPRKEDNVLSLDEYRAKLAARAAWEEPEDWDPSDDTSGAPRPRTDHSRDWMRVLEIVATIALIAAAAAACAAFLW